MELRDRAMCIWFVLLIICSAASLYATPPEQSYPPDSTEVTVRQFDPQSVQAFRDNPEFRYDREPVKMTWWDRLMYKIRRFLYGDSREGRTFWDIIGYVIAALALILIIFAILKIPFRSLFGADAKNTGVGFWDAGSDIHEMNFENLIREALDAGAYRRAVRLLYLEMLKMLTDQDLVRWRVNKTNQDYLLELSGSTILPDFAELTRRYEYVWYGNFPVDRQLYDSTEKVFRVFQDKVKGEKAQG
jgi:hypothetical protein